MGPVTRKYDTAAVDARSGRRTGGSDPWKALPMAGMMGHT
jgi:hypothetical protein